MKIKHGTYTGTGAAHAITGVGFAPDFVLAKRLTSSSNSQVRFTGQATAGSLEPSGTGYRSTGITSLDSDGFTLGSYSSANYSGATFLYLAIQADSLGLCKVGSYSGTGGADLAVDVGFQPDFLLILEDATTHANGVWTVSNAQPDVTLTFSSDANIAGAIKSLTSTGFTLGTDSRVNANGKTYLYLAIRNAVDGAATGTFTGNQSDPRSIAGAGFAPDQVWLKGNSANAPVWRTSDETGENASSQASLAEVGNNIQALEADGFQVGSALRSNETGIAFFWWATRDGTYTSPWHLVTGAEGGAASESSGVASTTFKTASDAGTSAMQHGVVEEMVVPKASADSGVGAEASQLAPIAAGDGGAGAETTLAAGEITVIGTADAIQVSADHAGYWGEDPGGDHQPWWYEGQIEARYEETDSGAAVDAGQVVTDWKDSADDATATEAMVDAAVMHARADGAVGTDVVPETFAAVADGDAGTGAEASTLVTLTVVADSDAGTGAEAGAITLIGWEAGDDAAATDAETWIAAESQAADYGQSGEHAERLTILERHIKECTIESTLEALADAFDMTLVERDPEAPLTPKAQAWTRLNQGDLVAIRLGLAGHGLVDYGTFRLDEAQLQPTDRELVTSLHGRDKAALLIEERGREAVTVYRMAAYPEQDAIEMVRPTSRTVAGRLAAMVGLGLVYDAPDYPLKDFTVRNDESVSSALSRLLAALQVSRRYRTDAWVDGDNLVLRRRGNGPLLGDLDCSLGLIRGISRARQPTVGNVKVMGGVDTLHNSFTRDDQPEKGAPDRQSAVEVEDDGQGHRVVRSYIAKWDANHEYQELIQTTEEVEDQEFEEVMDGDTWVGRVLVKTVETVTTDMNRPTPKTEKRVTRLTYDEQWRLIRRDELRRVYDATANEFRLRDMRVIRFEQITPTDVRTTTTEYKLVSDEPQVKAGFPIASEQPGTLQSALRTTASPDRAWDEDETGKQPGQTSTWDTAVQYQATRVGTVGAIAREYSDANLMSDAACLALATDLVGESGAWRYDFSLFWPRPFLYRKGDRVILTHLPGGMADTVAIITRVRTVFSMEQSAWTHDVSLEAWADE